MTGAPLSLLCSGNRERSDSQADGRGSRFCLTPTPPRRPRSLQRANVPGCSRRFSTKTRPGAEAERHCCFVRLHTDSFRKSFLLRTYKMDHVWTLSQLSSYITPLSSPQRLHQPPISLHPPPSNASSPSGSSVTELPVLLHHRSRVLLPIFLFSVSICPSTPAHLFVFSGDFKCIRIKGSPPFLRPSSGLWSSLLKLPLTQSERRALHWSKVRVR